MEPASADFYLTTSMTYVFAVSFSPARQKFARCSGVRVGRPLHRQTHYRRGVLLLSEARGLEPGDFGSRSSFERSTPALLIWVRANLLEAAVRTHNMRVGLSPTLT